MEFLGEWSLLARLGLVKKIGFCKQCLRNVPHIRIFFWPVFRLLNRFPALVNRLPIGGWCCCGCEKPVWLLRTPDPSLPTDVTSTDMSDVVPWPERSDPSQRFGLLFRRKRNAVFVSPESEAKKGAAESAIEHVGNFLRSDESLLVRKARASRYSAKFRDGIVNRILSGTLTISQARKDLGLSERDLLDWINDRIMRQDKKIAKLTQVVDSVQQLAIEGHIESNSHSDNEFDAYADDPPNSDEHRRSHFGTTIDGRVNQ